MLKNSLLTIQYKYMAKKIGFLYRKQNKKVFEKSNNDSHRVFGKMRQKIQIRFRGRILNSNRHSSKKRDKTVDLKVMINGKVHFQILLLYCTLTCTKRIIKY